MRVGRHGWEDASERIPPGTQLGASRVGSVNHIIPCSIRYPRNSETIFVIISASIDMLLSTVKLNYIHGDPLRFLFSCLIKLTTIPLRIQALPQGVFLS